MQQQLLAARVWVLLSLFLGVDQASILVACALPFKLSHNLSVSAAKLTPKGGPVSSGSVLQADVKKSCNRSKQQPARKATVTWE